MPQLVETLETGKLHEVFQSDDKPNMAESPLPRYELLTDMQYYDFMSVQTTRVARSTVNSATLLRSMAACLVSRRLHKSSRS